MTSADLITYAPLIAVLVALFGWPIFMVIVHDREPGNEIAGGFGVAIIAAAVTFVAVKAPLMTAWVAVGFAGLYAALSLLEKALTAWRNRRRGEP